MDMVFMPDEASTTLNNFLNCNKYTFSTNGLVLEIFENFSIQNSDHGF